MPGINDLKNDGNMTPRFIPSAEPTAQEIVQPVANMNTINMQSGQRVKADFSSLPKESEREQIGIDKKVSPVDDLLGDDFEKYLNEKRQDFANYQRELELAEEISDNNNDIELEISTPEDDEELEAKLAEASRFDISEMSKDEINARLNANKNNNVEWKDTYTKSRPVPETVPEQNIEEKIPVQKDAADDTEEDDDLEITRSIVADTSYSNDTDSEDEVTAELDENNEIKDEDNNEDEERLEILKSMITEKIRPVSKKLDIRGFTIAKGANIGSFVTNKEVPIAKWVLPATGVTFSIKEILGSDLEKMRFSISNGDERSALQIIYDHIVSPKPDTFIKWMKSIAYEDYDHLYFGIYIAAFADSNYMPIDCTNKKCSKKTYITDNTPINSLIDYKNEEAKLRISNLLKESPVELKGLAPTEIVPISESIAFGFRLPSLYSIIVEQNSLSKDFRDKYSTVTDIIPYIDNIYYIDFVNKRIIPATWKEYVNNEAKTLKSRIVQYNKIISTMPSDQLAVVRAYIGEINKHKDDITYKIPATTCPHCGQENPEQKNQSAMSMVFLRNQLGLLVNI